jgi:hypothetical protein
MGGSVEVKSKIGEGTEFIINIKMDCIVQKVKVQLPKDHLVSFAFACEDKSLVFIEKKWD